MSLASIGELSIHSPLFSTEKGSVEDLVMGSIDLSGVLSKAGNKMELKEEMLCWSFQVWRLLGISEWSKATSYF